MNRRSSYSKEELLSCSRGEMFGENNAQLPSGDMLMVDRITYISSESGNFSRGEILAEFDISPDLWFFSCHFPRRSSNAWLSRSRCNVATSRFFSWMAWKPR